MPHRRLPSSSPLAAWFASILLTSVAVARPAAGPPADPPAAPDASPSGSRAHPSTPPVTTRPATTQPSTTRSDSTGPDSTGPDSTEPDSTKPDGDAPPAYPAAEGFDAEGSDPRAIELAHATMAAMGGWEAWQSVRTITWTFFGIRTHVWDRRTGDLRITMDRKDRRPPVRIEMNLRTGEGRAWEGDVEVTGEAELAKFLDQGRSMWVNDSYWLLMPYKLKDAGVTLTWIGPGTTADGRAADRIDLTFEDVGLTPQNRYRVYVDRDTKLVSQWDFYAEADDEEPMFRTPWRDWRPFGPIRLSGDRGTLRGMDARLTDLAVTTDGDDTPE